MVWVALAYAVVGTWLTHLVGRPLITLDSASSAWKPTSATAWCASAKTWKASRCIRRGRGEGVLGHRFANVIANWWAIMQRTKMLNALTAGYEQVAMMFPFIVAAPRFFSGQIPLGGLTQTAGAFGRVQDALSWFITRYPDLAQWHAIVERLTTFHRAVVAARARSAPDCAGRCAGRTVQMRDATIELPNGAKLLANADLCWSLATPWSSPAAPAPENPPVPRAGRHLAVRPWQRAAPRRTLPVSAAATLYPAGLAPARDLLSASARHLQSRGHARALEMRAWRSSSRGSIDDEAWAQQLSGGEQQRVALARALLAKPDWLFLDEATASLDPEAEAELYRTLKARLANTTLVSIAHRPSVAAFHDRRLVLRREEGRPGELVQTELAAAAGGGG